MLLLSGMEEEEEEDVLFPIEPLVIEDCPCCPCCTPFPCIDVDRD
jgi:hypothetical protein